MISSVNSLAVFLLDLEPIGISLFVIHLFLMWRYRRSNPTKRFSWVLIVGSLIIPAIILLYYVYSFEIIDNVIGVHASRYHGYNFLVILIYPVLMPIYLILTWILNIVFKKVIFSHTIAIKNNV